MSMLSVAIDETRRALDRVDELYTQMLDPEQTQALRQISIEIASALAALMRLQRETQE